LWIVASAAATLTFPASLTPNATNLTDDVGSNLVAAAHDSPESFRRLNLTRGTTSTYACSVAGALGIP